MIRRHKLLLGVITVLTIISSYFIAPNSSIEAQHTIYLPLVQNNHCGMNDAELQFYGLVVNHPEQERTQFYCNKRIVNAAKFKAYDMSLNDYFGHVTENGIWPNKIAQDNNCAIGLEPNSNNVESIVAGTKDPKAAFDALMNSESHRVHLLGLHKQFEGYNKIGIKMGVNENSRYKYYWSIFIANC